MLERRSGHPLLYLSMFPCGVVVVAKDGPGICGSTLGENLGGLGRAKPRPPEPGQKSKP